MGHLNHQKAHKDLQRRLDQFPPSFPDTPEAMEILRLMFTAEEAELVARMPFKPQSAKAIARRAQRPVAETKRLLEQLAERGLILDLYNAKKDTSYYCVAPAVPGFFEFALMRRRTDIDQTALAQALESYEDAPVNLYRSLAGMPTTVGRTLVHEATIEPEDISELYTYERATDVMRSAKSAAVAMCYCRHKAEHMGKRCDKPMEACLFLNDAGTMAIRRGHGRSIDTVEGLEILQRSREASLVFLADNVQDGITYLCSCCGCCCMQLAAINRYGLESPIKTSPFVATIDRDKCSGCGRCTRICPIQAVQLHALPPHIQRKRRMYGKVEEDICLGCGVCKPVCKKDALTMKRRVERVITPQDTVERLVSMALEQGRLHHLLFDDEEGLHMVFLNRFVGAVLALPGVKQTLLRDELKSRFVGFLSDGARRMTPGMVPKRR